VSGGESVRELTLQLRDLVSHVPIPLRDIGPLGSNGPSILLIPIRENRMFPRAFLGF